MNFKEGEVLYFDKPLRWTSFAVVNKIRYHISRKLGVKKIKVGHAGTLDPLATGVMIICTGKATKRIEEFQYYTKEYIATLQLGATTPSYDLEKEIDIPIIGVVKPGAKVAAEATRNGQVGVIATEGTISSNIYTTYIRQLRPEVQVTGKACPLFVPLVEEGLWQDPVTDEIAKRYLSSLIDTGIDTLILGCTHYPLIRSTVAKVMGDHVTLVNPAYETARELKELLMEKGLFNPVPPQLGTNKYEFFVSDGAEKFVHFANSIIKYGILGAKVIQIEDY